MTQNNADFIHTKRENLKTFTIHVPMKHCYIDYLIKLSKNDLEINNKIKLIFFCYS